MLGTFKKVFPYILIGVGIGALIHNWIPESWIETVLGSNNPFGVIPRYNRWYPHVRRYFRHHSCCRGSTF